MQKYFKIYLHRHPEAAVVVVGAAGPDLAADETVGDDEDDERDEEEGEAEVESVACLTIASGPLGKICWTGVDSDPLTWINEIIISNLFLEEI